jgi:outer membrane protein assembly factor BamA
MEVRASVIAVFGVLLFGASTVNALALDATAAPAAISGDEVVSAVPLTAIFFKGNRVTQERVLRRELPFHEGQAVTEADLQRGRQAIQDLGLFNRVLMSHSTSAEGTTVTYEVVEKFYLLPYPRVDANADGDYAYGAQLRWNNVLGLNHTFNASVLQSQTSRAGLSSAREYSAGYFAPLIFNSQWSLGGGASVLERPVATTTGSYEEQLQSYQLIATRALGTGTATHGWMVGTGLAWQNQHTSNGVGEYGEALAPVGTLGYRDIRLKIYSEEGSAFGLRVEGAERGMAADYDYARLTLGGIRYIPVGNIPHQTVHLIGEMGLNWDGPRSLNNFRLGGSSSLRGYQRDLVEGNAYYRLATEWARPLLKPWLRTVVIAEVGNAYARPNEIDLGRARASIGFGLRLRVTTFVDLQLEAGIAIPVDGGSARFFAGKV